MELGGFLVYSFSVNMLKETCVHTIRAGCSEVALPECVQG